MFEATHRVPLGDSTFEVEEAGTDGKGFELWSLLKINLMLFLNHFFEIFLFWEYLINE